MTKEKNTTYTALFLNVVEEIGTDILIAELDEMGYEGFEEVERGMIKAVIKTAEYEGEKIEELLEKYKPVFKAAIHKLEIILPKNWNEEWEKNFKTVIVAGKILIKTPFQQIEQNYPYEIIINPKMAFGTGQHETTAMMLEAMLDMDFENKNVLDFGCGTGVLAIFALQKGAKNVLAIDYDEWAYENTLENAGLNNIFSQIQVKKGDIASVPNEKYDFILANVNKNVLTQAAERLSSSLVQNGKLLISGILKEDEPAMRLLYEKKHHLHSILNLHKANWTMLALEKS